MNCVGILSFLFILLTYLQVNNVQASLDGEGIVGGTNAKPFEYTYQVSLNKGSKQLCGGAIITKQHILTAAHCVTEDGILETHPLKVIAGVHDLNDKHSKTRLVRKVAKVYIPKIYSEIYAWNENEDNEPKQTEGDIAVLLLAKPIYFSLHPTLRKLELGNPENTYTGEAVITGFGWIHVLIKKNLAKGGVDETQGFSFGQLRYAKTHIISNELCSRIYSDNDELPPGESHICAQVVQPNKDKPEGVCTGDSGGPLVYGGNTIIGVLSSSPIGCREDIAPALYTKVSSFLDFIENAIHNVHDPEILTTQLLHN